MAIAKNLYNNKITYNGDGTPTAEEQLSANDANDLRDKIYETIDLLALIDNNDDGVVTSAQQITDGVNTVTAVQARGHIDNINNPHAVTKVQVGLGNVDNTSDANKPISTATQTALDGKAATVHIHDDRYYTESEIDALLATKAATVHTHDDRYYTESETNTLLNAKTDKTTSVTGTNSITGGGDLSANRTLQLDGDAATPGNNKYYGTGATGIKGYHDLTGTSYTDEQAQDAVGGILVDSTTINFDYDDAANELTAEVLPAGINHDELQNSGSNSHANIDTHIADTNIHLDQANVETIGDARYVKKLTSFTISTDSPVLTFDQRKSYATPYTPTGNFTPTLAGAGNVDDTVIDFELVLNGAKTVTFPSLVYTSNFTNGEALAAGTYRFFVVYLHGELSVAIQGPKI